MKVFAKIHVIVAAFFFLQYCIYTPSYAWVPSRWHSLHHHSGSSPTFPLTAPPPTTALRRQSVMTFAKTLLEPSKKCKSANDKKWDRVYARLENYVQNKGNADVPRSFNDGKSPHLGVWVKKQRDNYTNRSLPQERNAKLENLGMKWKFTTSDFSQQQRNEQTWDSAFQRLAVYKQKHSSTNVPICYNDGGTPHLGMWAQVQRKQYRILMKTNGVAGGITQERIHKLDSIGFVWDDIQQLLFDELWLRKFDDLKTFQAKYNSTKAPKLASDSTDPITALGIWVKNQIFQYNCLMNNKTSVLTIDQIEMLNSTNFSWSLGNKTTHEKWLYQYFKLYYHYYQYNNTVVSNSDAYNSQFVNWVSTQKQSYHDGDLDQLKIDLLNELNFDWTLDPAMSWDDCYVELCDYHEKYKSTLLNKNINENLAVWCQEQRKLYKKNELDNNAVSKLDLLGFDWDPVDVDWNSMYHRLLAYRNKHGHVLVPKLNGEDPPLGNWIRNQRRKYSPYFKGCEVVDKNLIAKVAKEKESRRVPAAVHEARLVKLADVDFVWDATEAQWIEMYHRLVAYQQLYNSTCVPNIYEDDPQLGQWVSTQRSLHTADKLEQKRKEQLDVIDFEWDPMEARWSEMFERLCTYSKENGNANVPQNCPADPQLGLWVLRQRVYYKQMRLSPERVAKLNSIDFVWAKNKIKEE